MTPRRTLPALLALLALALGVSLAAHEIPRSVVVHAYVKPAGRTLTVIVRAPLAAMRDVQFPERDGLLDVEASRPDVLESVGRWLVPTLAIFEDGERLGRPTIVATRVSLPSDRSFETFETALAHATAGDDADAVRLAWNQALVDAVIEYPIRSAEANFSIRPGFERLGVDVLTVLRFVTPRGVRAFELHGDPGVVRLDPRWHQAAWHFVKLGFAHILDGTDHLLFILCLVVPFRRMRPLIVIVTAFTVAHSITLISAAVGLAPQGLWFPPLIETLIAASIVYLALENILATSTAARRWGVAFAFGLVHGFGFSFALGDTLQFAGGHLLTSLLAFNVGVELGQIAVLLVLVPVLTFAFRAVPERMGIIVISALVAHTAWHWMTERWDALRQFSWPALETPALLLAVRVLLFAALVAASFWVARRAKERLKDSTTAPERSA